MRVLRIADVPNTRTGGMSRYMYLCGDALAAAGLTVDYLFQDDLDLHCPPRRRRVMVPLRVVQRVRELARAGRRYDVVEVHEPSAAAYTLARRLDPALPPCVVVVYALEGEAHRAKLSYARQKGDRLPTRSKYAHYTIIAQAELAVRTADHVTVETDDDRRHVIRRMGVPARRVSLVHGGLTDTFLAAPPPDSAARGVLFLASWIERKGIRDAVPALVTALQEHPDLPVTIAGCGVAEEVVRAAFPEPLRARLRVIPRLAGEAELLALYRQHAVYLLPSVREGQPLTLLEAAAAGLAVVGTNTCGMKDFIRPEETGLLVPVGDAAALTAAVLRLVSDPQLAARLGAAGQVAARRYTWKRSAEQFLAAAEAAVRHARRSRR